MKDNIKFKVVEYDDIYDNNYFGNKLFESYEDGWEAIYKEFPVIYNSDGTDDQEDMLDSFTVIPCDKFGNNIKHGISCGKISSDF